MHKEIFQKTKESLLLIPETVCLLRKQMFFEGSKRVTKLIQYLADISDYIMKDEALGLDKKEWILILQAFLGAQENKDYIMQADIMEGDLLIFLEKLQSSLLAEGHMVFHEYWEENLQSLKQVNPSLYQVIVKENGVMVSKQSEKIQYEPILAINGQPTLKVHMNETTFCMHSTINPEWEAKELAKSWIENCKQECKIFGMGMGYHVKALLEADKNLKVTVLEYRIQPLILALQYLDFAEFFKEGRLNIIYKSDLMKVLQKMNQGNEEYAFFLHYPSLQCVEQQALKEMLEDYFINISSMMEQGNFLKQNFEYLQKQKFPSCGELRKIFAGKNVVIVAGGPSVDDELESLKKYRKDVVILSVGTVARKLISVGIRPDAIIITDPQDTMYRQVEGLDADDIPLLLLSTASRSVVKHYHGPIYLVYQEGFEPAEQVAKANGYPLFQTGGSVTTTALDVSIVFDADKIILVGADMAYTDNRSHASGVGREEHDFSDYRQILSVGGGQVYTTRNLDIYRKWIERRIADLRQPVVFNTSRGARISGTVEMSLRKIVVGDT